MLWYDAHCHLQDKRLSDHLEEILALYESHGVARVAVNGTSPADWDSVARLAERSERIVPFFGLHPWQVAQAPGGWREELERWLYRFPRAGVGEIGLDLWIEGGDLEKQQEAFGWQWELATQLQRPMAVHCLKAWGPLQRALSVLPSPSRGFLMHSFSGSKDLLEQLSQRGAYFSLSGYFALEKKRKASEVLRAIPLGRLLIETDAPDMLGPAEYQEGRLAAAQGKECNHPINIIGNYRFAAELFNLSVEELAATVERNIHAFLDAAVARPSEDMG